MNILILNWRDVRHPKSGGAELVTMEHAKGWTRLGHRVTWLTAGYEGARSQDTVDGIHFIRRFGSLTIYLYAPFFLLSESGKFDVIVDEVHGLPFFSTLFTRKPVVVFIHEIAGDIWDYMYSFPINKIGKALEFLYFRIYKRCLFWTDAPSTIDELVKRGIKREQCQAIACPIIIDKHFRISKLVRKEKDPTYIFVSRVVRMKGIEEVIKAFSFIIRAESKSRLWIVGGGEANYENELKHMIQDYGGENQVTFYGQVSEPEKLTLMARAHILLHASVKEGWGLVVLESAYVGTPAVVYNVSGLKDIVLNRKTGIVIENNSPQEMAKEAITLLNDKKRYESYQKNAKIRVASFSWSYAVSQSLTILTKACDKNSGQNRGYDL